MGKLAKLAARVQRWHPIKLALVWVAYLAFTLWAYSEYVDGGWLYDLGHSMDSDVRLGNGGEYLTSFVWAVATAPIVWTTWQWASARERSK